MQYKALFFDFDGVLADSVEVKTRAFAEIFKEFGPRVQEKVVEHHRSNGGMTRKDKFVYYYKNFVKLPLSSAELEGLCRKFSALVVDEVVDSDEIPGALNILKKWSVSVPCFIVSATPDDEIIKIVTRRGLAGHFREILGSGRTKTENLSHLLKKYDLFPETSIFFGDAESDYRAAMACGVHFFGILPSPNAPLLKVAPTIEWAKDFTAPGFL